MNTDNLYLVCSCGCRFRFRDGAIKTKCAVDWCEEEWELEGETLIRKSDNLRRHVTEASLT